MKEVGFVYFFDCVDFFVNVGGNCLDFYWVIVVVFDYCGEEFVVNFIKFLVING